MQEILEELGKEITVPQEWEWRKGMVTLCGRIYIQYADCDEAYWVWVADDGCDLEPEEGMVPDLSHPATVGQVLHIIQTLTGCFDITIREDLTPSMSNTHNVWWRCVDSKGRQHGPSGSLVASANEEPPLTKARVYTAILKDLGQYLK